jgi:pimeloyl-ACP methyl ester carboxylesterase
LATDLRLVAMDLRGHGLSDKPADGYTDSRLWADDIAAAIRNLSLDRPILCGWSYGPLVILDYVRHYGEDAIAGIDIVGGESKLGSEEALAVLTPDFLALVPGFFSTDPRESARSLEALLHLCFAQELTPGELSLMLEASVAVPAHVRQGMFSRAIDNDDLLPRLRKPVLISHGARDAVVKTLAVEQHRALVPHAEVHLMAEAGHGCFWDDPPAFNRRLRTFANSHP